VEEKEKEKKEEERGGREREIPVNVSYLSMPLFHNSLLQI
jgi:hypothetical protein